MSLLYRSILQVLEDPNPPPGSRDRLYLYAVLAFVASMVKVLPLSL